MATLTKLTLLGLLLVGGSTIHGIAIKSGFYELVNAHKEKKFLSDGTIYTGHITHFAPVDDFLGTLVQFFWPCVDGNDAGLSLLSFLFSGQAFGFMAVMLVEGMRNGNKGKLVSYISIYGALFQSAGLALIGPAYLLLYTFTSPTVTSPTASNLSVDGRLLSGIPFAMTLGFVAPSVIMGLPSPSILSAEAKVKAIAAWQPVPIYAILLTYLYRSLSSAPSATSSKTQIEKLRTIYKYALGVAVPAHVATFTLSLSTIILPQIFTPAISTAFHPLNAIFPANPFAVASAPVASMSAGAMTFLQWDFWTSSSAYLIFALSTRFSSKVDAQGFSASALAGLGGRVAVLGPLGAVVSYMWERDEIVFGKGQELKKLK